MRIGITRFALHIKISENTSPAHPVESFVEILTTMWNLLIQCVEDDWTFRFFWIHCINVDTYVCIDFLYP